MKLIPKIILKYTVLQHILFWCTSYFILLYHFSIGGEIGLIDHIYAGLFHTALIFGVYVNLRIMIPIYLNRKRYVFYLFSLVVVVALMGAIHDMTFRYLTDWLFPDFYLISYISYNILVLYFSIYLILSTLLHLSKSWFSVRETERMLMRTEKEKFQVELKALKSQIQPHFLFNSLNNLYALSLKQSPILPEMLLKLSKVLRYILYEADARVVPLSREIQFIRDYVDLQLLRIQDKGIVTLNISGEITDQPIAPLIFINFIENAFKHGLKVPEKEAFMNIDIKIAEKKVVMNIVNNSPPPGTEDPLETKGIGLDNVIKRLRLRYPKKHELKIRDSEDIFEVYLLLDIS